MKTLHLQSNIVFFALLITISSFMSCANSESEGCTNAFASNYDALATKNCCCEFNEETIVDDLIGDYSFKIKPIDGSANYRYMNLSIEGHPNDAKKLIMKDYFLLDIEGRFENGIFELESEIEELLSCKSQSLGSLSRNGSALDLKLNYRTWLTSTVSDYASCDALDFRDEGQLILK